MGSVEEIAKRAFKRHELFWSKDPGSGGWVFKNGIKGVRVDLLSFKHEVDYFTGKTCFKWDFVVTVTKDDGNEVSEHKSGVEYRAATVKDMLDALASWSHLISMFLKEKGKQ